MMVFEQVEADRLRNYRVLRFSRARDEKDEKDEKELT